jgi:hypothetical protein
MKKLALIVVTLGLALGVGCRPDSPSSAVDQELMARVHFVGMTQLTGNTNATKLREIAALPATATLVDRTLRVYAQSLGQLAVPAAKNNPGEIGALLQPLWPDFWRSESVFQLFGAPKQIHEWMLALRLDNGRSALWSTNLWTLWMKYGGAKPIASGRAGYAVWEVANADGGSFRFTAAGPWTVVSWGKAGSVRSDRLLQQLKAQAQPPVSSTNWFEVEWDLAKLPPPWQPAWLDYCAPQVPPRAYLSVFGSGGYLRSHCSLKYPQDFNRPMQNWLVPTNIITDPVISFTVAQAFNPWLAQNDKVRMLGLQQLPNQMFMWSLSQTPFQSYVAFPLANGSNVVRQLHDKLPGFLKTLFPPNGVGAIQWQTNQATLMWNGLPFVVPYLYADRGLGGDYVVGGVFPTVATNLSPLPRELVGQVQGRTNLLYYDWEITSERLSQLQMLIPLLRLIDPQEEERLKQMPSDPQKRLGTAWIKVVQPLLGNTVTEAMLKSPREMWIQRKSLLGLNSSELYVLGNWLDSSGFAANTP